MTTKRPKIPVLCIEMFSLPKARRLLSAIAKRKILTPKQFAELTRPVYRLYIEERPL